MTTLQLPAFLDLTIGPAADGVRLDKALTVTLAARAETVPHLSRSQVRALILDGQVADTADPTAAVTATQRARVGQEFRLHLPPPAPPPLMAEAVDLDIRHEDEHLLVVNKPPHMVVHPAPTVLQGTLVNALLAHCGSALSTTGHPWRPGIVHRIDRGTSGLLVIAKTNAAHANLATQFAEHSVHREYLAIIWGAPQRGNPDVANKPGVSFHADGWLRIEADIGVDSNMRTRMAVVPRGGRRAVTHVRVESTAGASNEPALALVRCRLETGRTHQIRVHLSHLGHPLVGDSTYGRQRQLPAGAIPPAAAELVAQFHRPALHAATLAFAHPEGGKIMTFRIPPPRDFHDLAHTAGVPVPAEFTAPATDIDQ